MAAHDDALIRDGGPIYVETQQYLAKATQGTVVEPFNAGTAAIYIVIAVFWLIRVSRRTQGLSQAAARFLLVASTLLLVGGVGGTLYHGLRSSPVFLAADWLPILILCLSGAIWFLWRIGWKALRIALAVVGFFVWTFFIFGVLGPLLGRGAPMIALGYGSLAIALALPMAAHVRKLGRRHGNFLLGGLITTLVAISFRTMDEMRLLPMGTHFLWHIFGAFATHFVILYTWRVESAVQANADIERGAVR